MAPALSAGNTERMSTKHQGSFRFNWYFQSWRITMFYVVELQKPASAPAYVVEKLTAKSTRAPIGRSRCDTEKRAVRQWLHSYSHRVTM
jgi:hypothetical protein